MHTLIVRNVHEALPVAMDLMDEVGQWEDSRNGRVIVAPGPVTTVYEQPRERVLLHRWRNANPFFHLYESLWMLAGRRDVAPLARFVARMREFSDDGVTFNAAYGYRWRRLHVFDQIDGVVRILSESKHSRRAVLQIWDSSVDMFCRDALAESILYDGKDAACNLVATFQIRRGVLDMVVFCRSNDIVWGCYGANAVHFSVLQEYVATRVGVPVGRYTQISVNWHAYEDVWRRLKERRSRVEWLADSAAGEMRILHEAHRTTPYDADDFEPYSLMSTHHAKWDQDCARFVTASGMAPSPWQFHDPFFSEVALPMVQSRDAHKAGDVDKAEELASTIAAVDWRLACVEWIARRRRRG